MASFTCNLKKLIRSVFTGLLDISFIKMLHNELQIGISLASIYKIHIKFYQYQICEINIDARLIKKFYPYSISL